jgi:hypothetical protein
VIEPPVRVCCGHRHAGTVCPDGLVMCCLCFDRVPFDRLHVLGDGSRENVCVDCARREREWS